MVVGATVVDVTAVVGAAKVVVVGIALVVAGASGAAVSVAPPEQPETNRARIRNQASLHLMTKVCHEHRNCSQWWFLVEHLVGGVFAVLVIPSDSRDLVWVFREASPVKWGRLHA